MNQNVPLLRGKKHWHDCPELHKAAEGAAFIADYIRKEEEEKKVRCLYKYTAEIIPNTLVYGFLILDQRRLEIRGDGVGQVVLVDIHVGRDHGIGGHNPAGANPVR